MIKVKIKTNKEMFRILPMGVGCLAGDLPQCFQLRRLQKWFAGRKTIRSAEVVDTSFHSFP
jgi:hypothetical protein